MSGSLVSSVVICSFIHSPNLCPRHSYFLGANGSSHTGISKRTELISLKFLSAIISQLTRLHVPSPI